MESQLKILNINRKPKLLWDSPHVVQSPFAAEPCVPRQGTLNTLAPLKAIRVSRCVEISAVVGGNWLESAR